MKFVQPGNCENCKKLWATMAGRVEYRLGFSDGAAIAIDAREALRAARDLFKLMIVEESEASRVVKCVRYLEETISKAEGK